MKRLFIYIVTILLFLICASVSSSPDSLVSRKRSTAFRIRDKVVPISINDYSSTDAPLKSLTNEINGDVYHLYAWENSVRKHSDPEIIIVDIGANIGAFSIAACKYYPHAKIYAFEPLPQNYENLVLNLEQNNCSHNVVAVHSGVGKSDKPRKMNAKLQKNSGGASMFTQPNKYIFNVEAVPMTTIDSIIEKYDLPHISLLKIDCEGCEYNTLYNSKYLKKVKCLVGEWHLNKLLRSRGHSFQKLDSFIRRENPDIKMFHIDIEMRN